MTLHELHEDLEALLAGDEPDWDTDLEAPEDADSADRMLRRMRLLREERDSALEVAQAQRARIDLWLSCEQSRIDARLESLRSALEIYHRRLLAQDSKRKTVSLPNGRLVSRAQQPEYQFEEPVFVDWAERYNPDLIRVKEVRSIDKAAAKKFVADQGTTIPGVTVVERGPKFMAEPEV